MKTIVAFLVVFPLIFLYFLIKGIAKYKSRKIISGDVVKIQHNWVKLIVGIHQCEIYSKEDYQAISDESPSILNLLDSIGKEQKKRTISISIIKYKHVFGDGRVVVFKSEPMYMDEVTLKSKLLNSRICLYYDPNNQENYLFRI